MKDMPKSSARVLVIDDNEVNRVILLNMLELFDIHADEAEGGEKAVHMSMNNSYDLILIDHIMPGMNGIRTTSEIRSKALNREDVVIIALTADADEAIREHYRKVRANDVWEKPIELKDLATMLKTWELLTHGENMVQNTVPDDLADQAEFLKRIIDTIEDIDYEAGMKFALGNPVRFAEILYISQKDLRSCILIIVKAHENNSIKDLKMGIHKLKNILSNIGTIQLYEKTSVFERVLKDLSKSDTEYMYQILLSQVICFEDKLSAALEIIRTNRGEMLGMQGGVMQLMSAKEYEQSLLNAIYYIRRYEYEAIVRELKNLILGGNPEGREELQLALEDIRSFDYDSALAWILRVKNKTAESCPDV